MKTSFGGHPALVHAATSLAVAVALAAPAQAQQTELGHWIEGWSGPGHWRVAASPLTEHYRYSAEHRRVWAVAVERQRDDNWLLGASRFSNSFGQPSAYFYVGRRWPGLWQRPELFGQVSAGLLYGYKGKFEDKVPLNNNGFSPGALVTLGWQFNRQSSVAAHMLGDAGIMFQFSWDLR